MQTRKLYYESAYTRQFAARVLSCEKADGGWAVSLDATAFFPEEGGQSADTGTLGGTMVLDVRERDGVVTHLTDAPLPVGETVEGELDWAARFRKMQDHSGEHIVSGLVHARFGYDNVGFHLGTDGMTVDFSGELTRLQLDEIEDAANAVVWADKPVAACFPSAEELKTLDYRSKLDLTENVRLVTIPGVDVCACCAPHVSSTGQIGVIKLLDFMRHRGGTRIWIRRRADGLPGTLRLHGRGFGPFVCTANRHRRGGRAATCRTGIPVSGALGPKTRKFSRLYRLARADGRKPVPVR